MGDHDPHLAVADGFAQDASVDQGSHDAAALTPIAHQEQTKNKKETLCST